MKNTVILSLSLLLFGLTTTKHSCIAQDQTSDSSNSPIKIETINTSGSISSTPTPAYQGSVQKVELSLGKLRDIGLDLKHALKAASTLYEEVTVRPVTVITEPEMVGTGVVISIPVGTMPIGPVQPARKDRVDLAMSELKPIITMLGNNVAEFVSGNKQLDVTDNVRTELQPQFNEWISTVQNMTTQESNLEQLTQQGPPYDQNSIADIAVSVENSIKKLDELRRDIYKVMRKNKEH